MRKKLRSQRGDTLVETLAALLIVVLTITRQGGTGTGSAVRKGVSVYETEGGYRYYVYQE